MASDDLRVQELMRTIVDETTQVFESLQAAAQNTASQAVQEANTQFNLIVAKATESIANLDKDQHKRSILKEYAKNISEVEKSTTKEINQYWEMTKSKMNLALEGAKTTLGKNVKELEKLMKEMIKTIDAIVKETIKTIRNYSKECVAKINDLNK